MKRAFSLILALLLTLGCLSGCEQFFAILNETSLANTAASVFTLDVNPGLRIYVHKDNTILGIEATNDDGEKLLTELSLVGTPYEEAVSQILAAMKLMGYLEGEEASILITFEKEELPIADALNNKLTEVLGQYGITPAIIQQALTDLDVDANAIITHLAKKHNISKGKAHLIELLLAEFPELSAEDLASLSIRDLAMMLEELSEDAKAHFEHNCKHGEHHSDYISRKEAAYKALTSLNLPTDGTVPAYARASRKDHKTVYIVRIPANQQLHIVTVDASSGEILSTDVKECPEVDYDAMFRDFCKKHNISEDLPIEEILAMLQNLSLHGDHGAHKSEAPNRGELLKLVISALGIDAKRLDETEVEFHKTANGTAVCIISLEMKNDDEYTVVLEATTCTILSATLNGEAFELNLQTK